MPNESIATSENVIAIVKNTKTGKIRTYESNPKKSFWRGLLRIA